MLRKLPQPLSELFGAERADAVEAKTEDDPVFVSDSDVECVELDRERTAIVRIACGVK